MAVDRYIQFSLAPNAPRIFARNVQTVEFRTIDAQLFAFVTLLNRDDSVQTPVTIGQPAADAACAAAGFLPFAPAIGFFNPYAITHYEDDGTITTIYWTSNKTDRYTSAAVVALFSWIPTGANVFEAGAAASSARRIGLSNQATGIRSFAFGNAAQAQGQNSLAFGDGAIAQSANTFAFGANANPYGARAFAFGTGSQATTESFAFGTGARATGVNTIAMGFYSLASQQRAVAIGENAQAIAVSAFAFGQNSAASGSQSFALGVNAFAAIQAVAMGAQASAIGQSVAIGLQANAQGINGVVAGREAQINNDGAIAIGAFAQGFDLNSVAIGFGANVFAPSGVALGLSSSVTHENSVALQGRSSQRNNCTHVLSLSLQDDVFIDTPAGVRFGQSTSRIAFFGAIPIPQPEVSTGDTTQTQLLSLRNALVNLGLIKTIA